MAIRIISLVAFLVASVASEVYEVTCGDGQIFDMTEGEEFYWYSPGFWDGDDYPEDTECKLTFKVPAQHNWRITDIYNFDVNGDYANGCEGGDYVQFTVDGKKSKKFCGKGSDLSDEGLLMDEDCKWEDWCWPDTFEQVGNPQKPLFVEAVFKSTKRSGSSGRHLGFEILIEAGSAWDTEEPEVNQDGIPMLPMLEKNL